MNSLQKRRNILKDQGGILTLDFIFASVMIFALTGILFGFAMTFTAIEVAQYATFASARAYHAAHKNEDEQKRMGEEKFDKLVTSSNASLGFIFKNGWFELSPVQIDDFNDEFNEPADKDSDTFVGARSTFIARILNMNIPIFGSTTSDEMTANISSYLMREPTEAECLEFVKERFTRIQQLKSGFQTGNVNASDYAVIMDGGC